MNGQSPPPGPPPEQVAAFEKAMAEGHDKLKTGAFEAARHAYDYAVSAAWDPQTQIAAMFHRGRASSRMGMPDAALSDLDAVVRAAPTLVHAYMERGAIFVARRQEHDALIEYDRALALLPESASLERAMAYCNRGVCYSALGDHRAGLRDVKRAQAMAPEFRPAGHEVARIGALADGDGAGEEPVILSEQAQASAAVHRSRGWAAIEGGALVDALVCFCHALDDWRENAEALYGRGMTRCRLRQYPMAIVDLSRSLALHPNSVAAVTERGLAHVESGQHQEAMADYDRALGMDQTYAPAHINKGSLLAMYQRWSEAVAALNAGLALNPNDLTARFNRAACAEQLGDMTTARADLEFLAAHPEGGHIAAMAQQKLAQM